MITRTLALCFIVSQFVVAVASAVLSDLPHLYAFACLSAALLAWAYVKTGPRALLHGAVGSLWLGLGLTLYFADWGPPVGLDLWLATLNVSAWTTALELKVYIWRKSI